MGQGNFRPVWYKISMVKLRVLLLDAFLDGKNDVPDWKFKDKRNELLAGLKKYEVPK